VLAGIRDRLRYAIVMATVVLLATGLGLVVSGGATAGTSEQECRGHDPTVAGLTGTNGRDVIVGTNSADDIDGKGGNDIICGKRGDDHILGGTGNDNILANAGRDFVDAGEGDDKAKGNAGADCPQFPLNPAGCDLPRFDVDFSFSKGIYGGPGDDIVGGGTDNDIVNGEEDDDTNRCASGTDWSPDDEGTNRYRSCELRGPQSH
jgi:hypothetical protein